MNFYVYQQDFDEDNVHLLDIYVGPITPPSLIDHHLEVFTDVEALHEFLKSLKESLKVTQINTFKHRSCSNEFMNELNSWIETDLSLKPMILRILEKTSD